MTPETNKSIIEIDRSNIINKGYIGSCGVYHGFAYMPTYEQLGYTDEDREREFSRVNAMKLKVARTWFRPDFPQAALLRFGRWIEKMKELGVEVALNSGWYFTKDVWYFAHEKQNDPEYTKSAENFNTCADKFAFWIAKSIEYYILVKGFDNIKYLCLFTDPVSYEAGPVPEGMDYFDAYEICCRKIHDKLIEFGLREKIKLMGPNGIFASHDDTQLSRIIDRLDDVIDIYSMHTYSWCSQNFVKDKNFVMTGYKGWLDHASFIKKLAEKTEKPIWFDEYGLSGGSAAAESYRGGAWYGNYLAQINTAFINSGVSGSFLWMLFDQKYFTNVTNEDSFHNGIQRWGTTFMPGDNLPDSRSVRPSWYVISLLSRYMSGGNASVYKVNCGENAAAAATSPEEGKTSLLVVNLTGKDVSVSINAGISGLKRYLYDPKKIKPSAEKILIDSDMVTSTESFEDTLPPFGVAVYSDYNPM